MIEIDLVEWDVVLVSETWREEVEEYDTLESKHIWFGSGGTRGKHGVGILVHKRWSNHVRGWRAINTRIGVLDIDVGPWKLSVFVVYMPHGGKSDICLEEVYSTISTLVKEARSAKRMTILGGDWNAEVESAAWESHATVGAFANPKGNARGEWLHRWATSERLIIANTLFKKRWGCRWSHIQHGRKRTIDYICMDRCLRHKMADAGASKQIDLGSDHRAVYARLKLEKVRVCRWKQPKRSKSKVGWKPSDADLYNAQLYGRLVDLRRSAELELTADAIGHQLLKLEQLVVQTAETCTLADHKMTARLGLSGETQNLIKARRDCATLADWQVADRPRLSKMIQKSIRRDIRQHKRQRIEEQVAAFRDLKSISGIRKRGKKHNIASIMDAHSQLQTSRQNIVDVFADFYADLYSSRLVFNDIATTSTSESVLNVVPDITGEEVEVQLGKMKKNKAGDDAGLVAEMLQYGCHELRDILAQLFTRILNFGTEPPESWKQSFVTILFKKGDPKLPGNYRPICLLPIFIQIVLTDLMRQNCIEARCGTDGGPGGFPIRFQL